MRQFIASLGGGGVGGVITPITLRVAFFNTYLSIGTVGSAKYNAIKAHYARVDADVAIVDETPSSAHTLIVSNLAPELGYDYVERGANVSLGNSVMSKYPFVAVQWLNDAYNQSQGYTTGTEWAGSGTGAFRCQITKSGQSFIIYGLHLKFTTTPWDPTLPRPVDEYMRWCQLQVIFKDVAAQQAANPSAKILILGDFNDGTVNTQTATFASKPVGSYGSFTQDVNLYGYSYPITYSTFPFSVFSQNGQTLTQALDLDGSNLTLWANDPNAVVTSPVQLDYAHNIGGTLVGKEIVNSEATQTGGLTKYGSPLGFDDSRDASDHKMVFIDIIF